jgi:protoporphyrinogen oxidase
MKDVDLISYAVNELKVIGLDLRRHLISGFVERYKNAYPLYSLGYKKDVDILKSYLEQFLNFQTIGRAGLFRYDNSDHALLTGIYAANNYLGKKHHDVWAVNIDEKYLES